ncbi:uncharacterized protein LOC111697301 isoform X4 [Eurytemora carolleeae]|uniref:uncharacterized protein LOC111697301 isoform X4 n=1 Tax=Eurytemora carolleeae TaxID=1294199 RepID=UPI000C78828A|nr:uncharacterized protein LOC111697301 isoform X4 [Eurytemora carolleeae]|eukprot:XP_023323012.1 uncharacterized protein LOC111697301 isoform X4 [Eurytemora affinis]
MYLMNSVLFLLLLQVVESMYSLQDVEALLKMLKNSRPRPRCKTSIKHLNSYAIKLRENEDYLEDPITRFKFLKLLNFNIQKTCGLINSIQLKKAGYNAGEMGKVVLTLVNMMEAYNLSLHQLTEPVLQEDCILIAGFIDTIDLPQSMKLKYMNMFLENIEEADFSSEKLENHFEEVSDSLLDIQNEVDFQRICISHKETQGTKSCRIERGFYENLHIEVLSENPRVMLYHKFLTDFELKLARMEVNKNKFKKGSVMTEGDDENVDFRLGGSHSPHTDFYDENHIEEHETEGNRIAIAMIFLRATKRGGGFAMPRLNIYVEPIPGSLLVWYNVDNYGRNDEDTVHGGCPVYQGTKMIAITEYNALLQKDVCPKIY